MRIELPHKHFLDNNQIASGTNLAVVHSQLEVGNLIAAVETLRDLDFRAADLWLVQTALFIEGELVVEGWRHD